LSSVHNVGICKLLLVINTRSSSLTIWVVAWFSSVNNVGIC
jgi:hypothetical protein